MKQFALLALALCLTFASIHQIQAAPPAMSAPAVAAYDKLHQTETFALGGVGFAGTTSSGELAFRELQKEPDAAEIFTALLDDETTPKAAQLYALLGLRNANDAGFAERLPAFLEDDSTVSQMSGCILMPVKVKEIAASFVDKNAPARA